MAKAKKKAKKLSRLQYERRKVVAADEKICQLEKQVQSGNKEIRRLSDREKILENQLRDAVTRLGAEISARHKLEEQALGLFRASDKRAEEIIRDFESQLKRLKSDLSAQQALTALVRAQALRTIANYRKAGALLGIAHVMEDSALLAHRGLLEFAEKFGFDPDEVSVALGEMLRSASRRYDAVALPATDDHLWLFSKIKIGVTRGKTSHS